jgi:peptide/nickel transport system substrate-binding protein/microcin C transport system substrate-binding protein
MVVSMTLSVLRWPLRQAIRWRWARHVLWLLVPLCAVVSPAQAASPTKAAAAPAPASAPAALPAVPIQTGVWTHAISAYQPPKYPRGFDHFDYVNPAAPKGGTLRLSNPDRRASFDKFNPFNVKGVAPAAMLIFVFESLCQFSMDEPQAMYGLLAEEMRVEPDLSAMTFRLHPKARFANGAPVTADDVVYSFQSLTGPGALPAYQTQYAGVAKAVAVDARTVRFELKERKTEFVFALGGLPVFSRQWGAGKPFGQINSERPIASGPYVVDKAEMPSRLELKRNPDYWARDLGVSRGQYNFDRVVYRFYLDDAVRREAFKAGEFDLLQEYSAKAFARQHAGPKWRDGRIVRFNFEVDTGSMMQAIDYNLRRPKFQDIRVREALNLAFDFENYNRYGTFIRANSMFNNTEFAAQGLPSADELALLEPFRAELPVAVFGPAYQALRTDTGPNGLRDNLKRAAALLAQAGWTVATDGRLRNAAGEAFDIEFIDPLSPDRLNSWARNLEKLGIKLSGRQIDYALFTRRLDTFDFDIVVIVEGKFTLPNPADLLSLYGSKNASEESSNAYRGVRSKAVDALIDRISAATTMAELRTAARALDRVVMWHHWQMPMLYTRQYPVSYWAKFGLPAQRALYYEIDHVVGEHGSPWPLYTWWDKSLAPSQAPASGPVPAAAPRAPATSTPRP